MLPKTSLFVDFLLKCKGMEGIRVSLYLSIFKPKKFAVVVKAMVRGMLTKLGELSSVKKGIYDKYV